MLIVPASHKRRRAPSPDEAHKRRKYNPVEQKALTPQSTTSSLPIPILTTDWVSASATRNYALGDPMVDWLNLHGEASGLAPDTKSAGYDRRLDFKQFIMGQGCAFEARIMERLRERFGDEMVEIQSVSSAIQMRQTLEAMERGVPIITQAHLWEPRSRVHGHPDLLVRSDYLNRLVEVPAVSDRPQGCRMSPDWHYRVVDIKFATLYLKADCTTLLNRGSAKAFKAQVCVYTVCLGYMQGHHPGRAYLLGRGWEATKRGQTIFSRDPLSKLGVVDLLHDDLEMVGVAAEAVGWVRRCRLQGREWRVLPKPSVPELYPNMCNDSATGWDTARKRIASELREITLVWQCGQSAREDAHAQGIFTWDDPRCNATRLGINGPKLKPVLDALLGVNREGPALLPTKIASSRYGWRQAGPADFFLDVESVSNIHSIEPDATGMIYLIGLGWVEGSEWRHRTFVAADLEPSHEEVIVRQLLDLIRERTRDAPGAQIKLYHYANADEALLSKVLGRLSLPPETQTIVDRLVFCDLYRLVLQEPVLVRGALDFSLKSIVSALHEQGRVKVTYEGSHIQSGMGGAMAAMAAASQREIPFGEHPLIRQACIYNETDCRSLWEILDYFRMNM